MLPIMKQTPENKPRCLLRVTWSVGKTVSKESGWTADVNEQRRWGIIGEYTCRRWIESESIWDDDDDTNGATWLF